MARPILPPRKIRIEGDVAYVPLTQGFEAVIDAVDLPLVAAFNWCVKVRWRTVYAQRTLHGTYRGKRQAVLLHRVITDAPENMQVDHKDGNGLNCRRNNLRQATNSQNQRNTRTRVDNTAGFKGVNLCKDRGVWQARIQVEGSRIHLGFFTTAEDAHAAYARASAALHGEFGRVA